LSPVALALILSVGTVESVVAQQRWYEAYEQALDAIERRDWVRAEELLRTALTLNSRQGRRVLFYGTRREDYLPDYFLGVVYANQGRAQEALDRFSKVERDGLVVNGSREYAELQRMSASARTQLDKERLVRAPGPPPNIPSPLAPAPTTAAPVAIAPPTPPRTGGDAAAAAIEAARRARFNDLIATAAADIEAGHFDQARDRLADARAIGMDPARVAELERRASAAATERAIDSAVARRDWADAQRRINELRQLDARNGRLRGYEAAMARGLAVAKTERTALLAFYEGDYAKTIALLQPYSAGADASPRLLFYLACSNVAVGLLEGPAGGPRIKEAREFYARARVEAAALAVDRRFVSPTILVYLEGDNARRRSRGARD
jgi:hypothetical protein